MHLIFSTMDRIQNNFINGIFSQNKYNTYMIQLDNLYEKFQSLPRPLTIKEYALIGEENIIRRISDIKLELIYICKNSGMKNILDIVNLVINLTITNKIDNYKLINFYNKNFIPINCDIYTINGKPKFIDKNQQEKENEDVESDTNILLHVKKSINNNLQKTAFEYEKI